MLKNLKTTIFVFLIVMFLYYCSVFLKTDKLIKIQNQSNNTLKPNKNTVSQFDDGNDTHPSVSDSNIEIGIKKDSNDDEKDSEIDKIIELFELGPWENEATWIDALLGTDRLNRMALPWNISYEYFPNNKKNGCYKLIKIFDTLDTRNSAMEYCSIFLRQIIEGKGSCIDRLSEYRNTSEYIDLIGSGLSHLLLNAGVEGEAKQIVVKYVLSRLQSNEISKRMWGISYLLKSLIYLDETGLCGIPPESFKYIFAK